MKLILVRHSQSTFDKDRPIRLWKLSETGVERASNLSESSLFVNVDLYVTSPQLKATHTCALIASNHPAPIQVHSGLDETTSVTNKIIDDFENEMHTYLHSSDYSMNGWETAKEAKERLAKSISEIVKQWVDNWLEKIVIVSHGTVLSLFSADFLGKSPYEFHHLLRMPDIAVLDREKKEFINMFGEEKIA